MSFPVYFYTNNSASNVVDKDLTQLTNRTGTLRDGTSVIDPVIRFQSAGNAELALFRDSNYCYIAEFGRYYYITEIITVQERLIEVHMHVDVLMTYKNVIRAQMAVVSRQAEQYNLMLDDGWFMSYQNPKVQTKYFSNPTPFETQEFVLVVAGS